MSPLRRRDRRDTLRAFLLGLVVSFAALVVLSL